MKHEKTAGGKTPPAKVHIKQPPFITTNAAKPSCKRADRICDMKQKLLPCQDTTKEIAMIQNNPKGS
jgi:hypothetical protein